MASFGEALQLARQLLGAGDLAQAEPIYRRLVEAVPHAAEPWHELGILHLQANRSEVAVECLRRAVSLEPHVAAHQVNLALAYRMAGRPVEAVASFEQALKLGPPTAELLNNFALSLKDLRQSEAALRAFDRALALRPQYANGHFNRGNLLVEIGNLEEAAASYRRAIDCAPQDAVAHCKLGMVYCDLARAGQTHFANGVASGNAMGASSGTAPAAVNGATLDEAVRAFRQALALEPGFVEAYSNLAVALAEQGHFDDAVACCRRALELKPDFADALNTLGAILEKQGDFDAAMACWRRALKLEPGLREVQINLGTAFTRRGDYAEAAQSWRRALELDPTNAVVHGNLGSVLEKAGKLDEAVACWQRAVELDPNFAEAHNNLGTLLAKQEQFAQAAASFRRALELRPNFVAALFNYGGMLARQERFEEAAEHSRRVLELQPDFADASTALGIQLAQLGRVDEAKTVYQRAGQLDPTNDVWILNRLALCPTVFPSTAAILHYRAELLAELEVLSQRVVNVDPIALVTSSCAPAFNLQFHGENVRPIREGYGKLFRDQFAREAPAGSPSGRRIGFVVTDHHETGFVKHMGGILEHIDPSLFELVVVGSQRGMETIRAGVRNEAVTFVPAPTAFDRLAETIREARCDVLHHWEIGTDNTNYFLPFCRLAPVQCTSWGMQVTSGIPEMDYYLSSELVEPADARDHYTEKLVLARTLLTYARRHTLPATARPRDYFGLAADAHVYLCAQQLGKFQPDFDPLLAEILRQDPRGLIVITDDRPGGLQGEQLRARFAAAMPEVVERIKFLPVQPAAEYLSLIAAADVLLDPLHFAGLNTSYDGFSLGQPIVTLPTRYERSRYTLGCYQKMGWSDCVASTPDEYVTIAVALANDRAFRASVVKKIRDTCGVLFEDAEAVREFERIYGELTEVSRAAHG